MKTLISSLAALAPAVLAVGACTPFDPDLGDAPYLCSAASPDCPDGYTCQSTGEAAPRDMACLREGGSLPDGGTTGFQCLQDSFGDNDTIMGAFQTPVAQQNQMFAALTSLCPELDRDNYAVTITTPSTLLVTTSWESGSPVNVSILNAGGTSIGNGTQVGDTNAMCVCGNNLPNGTYYASVFAAATVQNNYRVEIKIGTTADCTAAPVCN